MPEAIPFLKHFSAGAVAEWEKQLILNRQVLERGLKMKLLRRAPLSSFTTLDAFMLHLHSDILSDILEAYASFAKKVVPLILAEPDAQGWFFHKNLLVQRRDWRQLARRVLNLVKLLSVANHNDPSADSRPEWPHRDRLRSALRRAESAYGAFAVADIIVSRLRLPGMQGPARASRHPSSEGRTPTAPGFEGCA